MVVSAIGGCRALFAEFEVFGMRVSDWMWDHPPFGPSAFAGFAGRAPPSEQEGVIYLRVVH